jgi:hypothetical protein
MYRVEGAVVDVKQGAICPVWAHRGKWPNMRAGRFWRGGAT